MKRLFSTILAMIMLLSMATVFAQEIGVIPPQGINEGLVQNVLSTKGEITEISEGQVRILGKGSYNEIVLHTKDSTSILNAQDGTQISLKDLKKGDAIIAYYGPMVTRSMPPQATAIALLVETPEKGSAGMYMKVAKLEENKDGSIKVLCTNSDRLVTILPAVFAKIADIKEGSELILWYDMMTMSLPAQATATKVVLLPAKDNVNVHIGAGTIVVNGKEISLMENDIIRNSDNTVMLPLRVIAESLGYKVIWDGKNDTVQLQKGARTMNMTIGSKEYGKSKMIIQLNDAPEIINGKTLVPVDFFTNVMNITLEISNNHI